MRVSVAIATNNRAAGLRAVLDALRHQTFLDFEVVVVVGPSQDDTAQVLAAREDWLRVVENPELNLGKSRNLAIDMAAGDVVAFIDDDAIPEPRWLEDLVSAFVAARVGGAGGVVYDASGVRLQYRYAVCTRIGEPDFDRRRPLDDFNRVAADPCLYLQGTNMSYRRDVLDEIGGFDENLEYLYDDVDIAMQVIDAGWRVAALDGAPVHHKVLPSALRRGKAEVTDPFIPVKNRTYFAFRAGMGTRSAEEATRSLTAYLDMLRNHAESLERRGRFTRAEKSHFIARMEEGFEAGFVQGTTAGRAGRGLAPRDLREFKRYPVIRAAKDRLSICFASVDYPPKPMGGIARYTVELARRAAALGHDIHVVTEAELPYRLDFEDGVWVHRYPRNERLLPSLSGHPAKYQLAHVAAVWRAIVDLAGRFPVDVVAGNVWLAEVLLSGLDPRWPTVMTMSTPQRTIAVTQPAMAEKPEVPWQIELEHAALAAADQLHAVSQAVLAEIRAQVPEAKDVPAEVIWHGLDDRARHVEEPQPHAGIEILFVGRLEPRKGVDTLLAASARLLRERPDVRLRVVGADNPYPSEDPRPYSERVREQLASEPDVLARIEFEGEVSDGKLDKLLRRCDIFCAPSRYESFGLMNLEAMMFSRPVVSTQVGGIQEVVVDGETGILVEPDDVEGLFAALRRLVEDPALAERMGRAGRARYEAEFTSEIAVARMLDLFQRTIDRVPQACVGDSEAESLVRARFADFLEELGGVESAAQAAAQLLDPVAFPQDYLGAIAQLENATDRDFVAGIYRSILQREPDPEGLEVKVLSLTSGARSRADIVREIATGDEAKVLGVDTRFLDRLQQGAPSETVRRVRDAFWRSDRSFAASLVEIFLPPTARRDATVDVLVSRLEGGATRRSVLDEVMRQAEGSFAPAELSEVLEQEFLTTGEVEQRLRELATLEDSTFVYGLYRLLLGREAEPDGAADKVALLRLVPRREVVMEVAGSVEAMARGVDPAVIAPMAERIRELGVISETPRRLGGIPGAQQARRVGRRVLRDPEVRGLRAELHRMQQALAEVHRMQAGIADQVSARSHDVELFDRLNAELRGVATEIDRLRAKSSREAGELRQLVSDELQRLAEPPTGVHGTYVGDGRMLIGTVWGGMLVAPAGDMSLMPELVTHGIYEPAFTHYVMRSLRQGDKVIDVGANIGMYTVLMAGLVGASGQVLAYEPNPDVLPFLRENIALNWSNHRVDIRPAAASDVAGKLSLYVTERFMGNSSLLRPGRSYYANVPMDTVREVEVDVERLDTAVSPDDRFALVKIDVEGAELKVIRGMTKLLDKRHVDRLAFEVYRERMGADWSQFADLLRDYADQGWTLHEVSDDGDLSEVSPERVIEVGRYSQVVMCAPPASRE